MESEKVVFEEGCSQCGQYNCVCAEEDFFFENGFGKKRSITARRIK